MNRTAFSLLELIIAFCILCSVAYTAVAYLGPKLTQSALEVAKPVQAEEAKAVFHDQGKWVDWYGGVWTSLSEKMNTMTTDEIQSIKLWTNSDGNPHIVYYTHLW